MDFKKGTNMKKYQLLTNNIPCGETRELRRISSGRFDNVLCITPHFGWHHSNENYGIYRSSGLTNDYIIFLTVDGFGDIEINKTKYTAGANSVCIIPPLTPHRYATAGSSWEFFWMHIKKGPGTDILDYILNERGYIYNTTNIEQLPARIDMLLDSQKFGIEAEIYDSRMVSRLLHDMLDQVVRNGNMALDNNDVIKAMLNYIDNHYMEKISVEDLSRLIYKSVGHTIRIFKYYTGYTPIEYIKKYRIMKACQLLDTTDYSIKRISLETGYKSVSHFIADFRSMKTLTPHEYREKISNAQNLK